MLARATLRHKAHLRRRGRAAGPPRPSPPPCNCGSPWGRAGAAGGHARNRSPFKLG